MSEGSESRGTGGRARAVLSQRESQPSTGRRRRAKCNVAIQQAGCARLAARGAAAG